MKKISLIVILMITSLSFSQSQALETSIKTLKGETTSLSEFTAKNDLVIVSLWATWCVPCKNELDAINEVYQDWQDETNVKLVAVSIDDSRTVNRVKPLVNGKDWDYTILLDTNNDLKRALNTATVPLTLIVKNGEIVYRHSGYTPGAEDALYEELKKHI
ncbi:TlpA disulfide reductase family protein [Oceanihabitans sediminis]|uniref:TlpA family protein disulfide reductase n=1 Tax=Oceanihabitans sediminis TaxID=1812012 RepID=A0A368PAI9_9FLAO|nr:TlpA disulfide reductase family protein [Oceanihabitans sediminis]MDX1277667.1 TlpA disulfide reductase family protein [Oceanihabitans sediminis]RCU58945.1 TlpA family protein disulfide reductase [Oceanihabitans sediminis]